SRRRTRIRARGTRGKIVHDARSRPSLAAHGPAIADTSAPPGLRRASQGRFAIASTGAPYGPGIENGVRHHFSRGAGKKVPDTILPRGVAAVVIAPTGRRLAGRGREGIGGATGFVPVRGKYGYTGGHETPGCDRPRDGPTGVRRLLARRRAGRSRAGDAGTGEHRLGQAGAARQELGRRRREAARGDCR